MTKRVFGSEDASPDKCADELLRTPIVMISSHSMYRYILAGDYHIYSTWTTFALQSDSKTTALYKFAFRGGQDEY